MMIRTERPMSKAIVPHRRFRHALIRRFRPISKGMHLETRQLSVSFGSARALEGVSLDFPVGSHTVIFGPAAGGKTTLLKCLTGLLAPSSGKVVWGTRTVASRTASERRAAQVAFGMVFQSDALFDSLSVLDNVVLPLRKRGVAPADAARRARQALDRVGLGTAADKSPETLSGGMKKRAGVARAIVAQPDVLIADDPFAGLDPTTLKAIAALLLDVSRDRTLIVALPDPEPALPLERTIHLVKGALAPW
jgi:phospholipid/cholesterol/gamma-HCH transport system ATP-binding protein